MNTVAPSRSWRIDVGGALYLTLAVLGWSATTVLAAAGLFVLLFALAGNGSLGGFFEQVQLLASHYLAADAARRGSFDGQAAIAATLVVGATGFFRRGALIATIRKGVSDGSQRNAGA